MRLSVSVIESLFEELRKLQLIHVKGTVGNDYAFELTSAGRNQASESSEFCHYAGPAPGWVLPGIRAQAAKVKVNRARLRAALSDLVVSDRVLDQLGPALISQQSLFLYRPTGNGKTSYAERLVRVYGDMVVMPFTVEVDGQIVILHDPLVHRKTPIDTQGLDPRWVVCQRPCITVGVGAGVKSLGPANRQSIRYLSGSSADESQQWNADHLETNDKAAAQTKRKSARIWRGDGVELATQGRRQAPAELVWRRLILKYIGLTSLDSERQRS
jgi:hypothetical protein